MEKTTETLAKSINRCLCGYLTGNTFEHYNMCLHWAMERGSGWHSSFLHRALYTHMHTHIHSQKPGICPALAGADAAMRTVISPTVAVATPTRGKSLIVCAHACVCMCVRLWLWQKLELEEEKEEEEEEKEGLQEFTLCLACLRFMPHSLTTLYQGEYWTGPFNYQGNKFSMAVSLK